MNKVVKDEYSRNTKGMEKLEKKCELIKGMDCCRKRVNCGEEWSKFYKE